MSEGCFVDVGGIVDHHFLLTTFVFHKIFNKI